jgi:hypothetical protein
LFGGSVGPIRKQLPSGQFQNVYEGVKVRAQPLPLRVPTSPQQTAAQQHTQVIQQQQVIKAGAGVLPPPNPQRPFICEWAGCMKDFRTPKEVEKHAIVTHCAYISGQVDMPCLWSRCDGMKRKRFSLMTHIQDRHCHPQVSE